MKNNYRRILSIGLLSVLVVSLVFMLTGCGFLAKAPTAEISVDPGTSVNVGEDVEFDGGDSDPGGSNAEITDYDWTFPDEFTVSGSSDDNSVQSGSFSTADSYTVTLEVTNDAGKSDEDSVEIDVSS